MKKLDHIAYNKTKGKGLTIVFLSGFRSDMNGNKAIFMEGFCKKLGLGFVRFDYSGHGSSGHDFKECTIGTWLKDALKVIDELTTGEIILVGSSMGGWIALLAALKRKKRIKAILGIAAAPDFTEELIWQKMDEFTRHKILRDGVLMMPNCYDNKQPYPITLKLVEEGRKHLLLKDKINLSCPMRFVQGMADEDVPFETAHRIASLVKSKDVEVHLLKNSGHRMSEPHELELIKTKLLELI